MTSFRAARAAALCAVVVAGAAVPAQAQEGGATPNSRALFGSSRSPQGAQSLNLNFLVAESYDDDVLGDLRPDVSPGALQVAGLHTTLSGAGEYRRTTQRQAELRASGIAMFRYYNDLSEMRSLAHAAEVGASLPFNRRTTLRANQAIAYSPSYLFGLFPEAPTDDLGGGLPAAPDYTAYDTESLAHRTAVSLTREIGRGSQLSASTEYGYTDYARESALRADMDTLDLRGEFRHGVSRNVALRFGYGYRTGDYGQVADTTTTEHRADVGVDVTRRLSAFRSFQLLASVGLSAADIPDVPGVVAFGRKYGVQGESTLRFQFSRDWTATGTYRRGLEYMPALTQPVFADGFQSGVEGLIGRRTSVQVAAGYASGDSILLPEDTGFDTYTGHARVQVAATRQVAFFGEYLYYSYDFSGNPLLAPGIPTTLERNGVRGGIMLWVPAIGR